MSSRPYSRRKKSACSPDDTDEIRSWRFLRVMPTSFLQESMQRIPCEFASKFSSEPSTFASFSVPNHSSWTIKVIKKKNKLQLSTGWDRFVKDNSIHDGDMMIFKYKGNCEFKVNIFDPVGSEIVQCHNYSESGKRKIGSCNESRQEVTSSVNEEREEKVCKEDHGRNPCFKTKLRNKNLSSLMGSRKKTATNHEENSSKLEALLLSLENPFFFAKTNGSRNELLIPSDVIRTFNIHFDEALSLEDPKGRKWEARIVTWKDGRTRLTGWKQFCKYNLVRDQDACVCEFIPSNGPTCYAIKVHIFRDQKKPATVC